MLIRTQATLGETVRAQLRSMKKRRTQKWLAKELRITEAELSKRLNGQKVMGEDEVVHLAEILGLPLPCMLLLAAAARCDTRAREARKKIKVTNDPSAEVERQRYETAQRSYRDLLEARDTEDTSTVRAKRKYISLENFPDMISGPWTIIVGDRRESPVKGVSDLIGLSVASSDFMFLHRLALPADTTVMRSDKTILIASESSLRELMKTNLLVIGSPAVSLGTRAILRDAGATFMFNIGNEAYDRERKLYERIDSPAPRDELENFILRKDVEEELDDLLATFRKNGFVDPIDFKGIRGRAIAQYEDYGMVSLASNPWSDDHIVCICAGVHGGGTAGAVQLLASSSSFIEHPWGGVFRVSMSDQVPWEKRFENLAPRWETHRYNPDEYLADIDQLISRADLLSNGSKRDDEVRQLDLDREILTRARDFAAKRLRSF